MILHLVNSEKLKLSNGVLYVIKDEEKILIDIKNFNCIVIDTTRISLTSSAILFTIENKVPIILCNNKHMPTVFCFDIFMNYKTSERIKKQISWENERKQFLWKEIIKEKINGQRNNILKLDKSFKVYDTLSNYYDNVEVCDNEGVQYQEAVSARVYFKELFGNEFKRHNEDDINYALNYGYSLLRSYISCIIVGKGLHPSIGVSHSSVFNTYNFSDDIIEIFRPVVDFFVYNEFQYNKTFNRDFRKKLLNILEEEIYYKDNSVNMRKGIEMFLDNVILFFEDYDELYIPKLELDYAKE